MIQVVGFCESWRWYRNSRGFGTLAVFHVPVSSTKLCLGLSSGRTPTTEDSRSNVLRIRAARRSQRNPKALPKASCRFHQDATMCTSEFAFSVSERWPFPHKIRTQMESFPRTCPTRELPPTGRSACGGSGTLNPPLRRCGRESFRYLFIDSHVVQCVSEGTNRKQEILKHMRRVFITQ